jgi:site-specific DNA recombinase
MAYKNSLRVALYARFSSDNQRSESIDAQVRAMTKYCKENNLKIVATYIDKAKSAMTDKRPFFQDLILDAKKHIFDAVLVHKLDRFSRNRYDSAMYKRELSKSGIKVYSVLERLDDSPESVMMESLLEGMSEYYSKNLAREVMKGMNETARQCKHLGGLSPLGYDIGEDRKLVINEREAEAVRMIFTLYDLGHGYQYIINMLNENNYLTKLGRPFGKNSIYTILMNEKYSGVYVFNKSESKDFANQRNTHAYKQDEHIIRIPGGCPKIVERELFERTQQKMQDNKHHSGRYKAKVSYMLSGKVRCGICGKMLYGNNRFSGRNKTQYITYRCPTSKHHCDNKEISQPYLENYVIEIIKKTFLNKETLTKCLARINSYIDIQQGDLGNKIAEYKAKLVTVNKAISNITAAIEGGMLIDNFIERVNELEEEKFILESKISKNPSSYAGKYDIENVDSMLEIYKDCMKDLKSKKCKKFVQDMVQEILVYRDKAVITLKTGFNISNKLNKSFTVTREIIYDNYGRSKYVS